MEKQTEEKIMNLLHLSRKAGKLAMGMFECEKLIARNRCYLVLVSGDFSENNRNKIVSMARKNKIVCKDFLTKKQLGFAMGRNELGVLSIKDKNFADGILKLYPA